MVSPFRFAGIITVIFAVCGPARAQELAPPGSGVTINKLVIDSASSHTVKYYVKGGSPRLEAVVRRVEWIENELSVIEQLQLLKLDTVVYERRAAAYRSAQLTTPYFPPGFSPLYTPSDYGYDGASPLQRGLARQLAYEATPQAALQLIGFLEQQQTQLDAELKALPPQEKKAAQGPIDALRPRLAALLPRDVPPPAPKPVVSRPQAVPQRVPVRQDPVAYQPRARQKPVEVEWQGTWWAAEVVNTNGNRYYIHYTGWANSWDEWVTPDRIR